MLIRSIKRAVAPQNILVSALIGLTVTGVAVAAVTVGSAQLKRNAVTTSKIKNNTVTAAKLRRNAVTTPKIKNGSVTAAKMKNGAVTGPKLRDNSITGDKIRLDTLGTVPAAANADAAAHAATAATATTASTATTAGTASTALDAAALGGRTADQYVTRSAHVTWYKELSIGEEYSVKIGPIVVSNHCQSWRALVMVASPGVRGTSVRGTRTNGNGATVTGGSVADLQTSLLYSVAYGEPLAPAADRIMRLSFGLKTADGSVFVPWPGAGSTKIHTANVTAVAGPINFTSPNVYGLSTTSDCTFYGDLNNLAG